MSSTSWTDKFRHLFIASDAYVKLFSSSDATECTCVAIYIHFHRKYLYFSSNKTLVTFLAVCDKSGGIWYKCDGPVINNGLLFLPHYLTDVTEIWRKYIKECKKEISYDAWKSVYFSDGMCAAPNNKFQVENVKLH